MSPPHVERERIVNMRRRLAYLGQRRGQDRWATGLEAEIRTRQCWVALVACGDSRCADARNRCAHALTRPLARARGAGRPGVRRRTQSSRAGPGEPEGEPPAPTQDARA
jgi:hypothetical protein